MEIRNMSLENEEKAILVIKWQCTWPNYVSVLVFYGGQNLRKMKLYI